MIIDQQLKPPHQVDSFDQRLKLGKAEVGLEKLNSSVESSSLAEFAAEIQRDGDQV